MSDKPLAGRVALVTGASRGLGAAIAVVLGAAGAQVVALARNAAALEETDDAIRAAGGAPASLLALDLARGEDVDMIGPTIAQRFGRLDIVVGNAAVLGRLGPVTHLPAKDWAEVMAVNLTANWHLMRTTEPLLRASDAGRAVFVTSRRAAQPKAYWGAYGASKAALEHLAITWAQELAITPVKVNLFDPGIVRTRMRAAAMPGENPMTVPAPEEVAPKVLPLCLPSETRSGEIIRA
ncbi:SDR family NAD(P)-dependent oxidoreductase [Elioraea tepida]|jgi:NAD(P)-dependent dehydrogenase (short-subunit alcohol dehydrogenase family)|uniref:SDR family NAD(P)-dependent oxidoreductase n=1 Tax=Elioraea tepida TaxID=2843330 RepID=A0A975TZS5_9PROT|nr:SDR family NAD(P)-dependent oxidoreductase [Elioraea tepida]QXM23552.1 SDR family NAD(P)-dependent oxidoreductase [Elioraea tepida]